LTDETAFPFGGPMANRRTQPGDAQMSLAGFIDAAQKDRLFLGIFPDQPAQAAIAEVAQRVLREHGLHGQPIHPSRFHLTVHHLGDYPELPPGRIDAALAAMARIATPPWDITLDHVSSFRGRGKHPIVLRCADGHSGVHALWRESRAQLAAAGFSPWLQHDFTPHLTMFYGDRLLSAPIPIEPIAWTVNEVALVHSLLGKTEYRILGKTRLAMTNGCQSRR
jgi:2'-5' RNA ligase